MSKFWQKKYISKYTGAEIDAAVAKADTVPAVTVEDAGKALVVDEDGKIVPGQVSGGVIDGDYKPTGATYTFSDLLAYAIGTSVNSGNTSGYTVGMSPEAELSQYLFDEIMAGKNRISGIVTGTMGAVQVSIPYLCDIVYISKQIQGAGEEVDTINFAIHATVNMVVMIINVDFNMYIGRSQGSCCCYEIFKGSD